MQGASDPELKLHQSISSTIVDVRAKYHQAWCILSFLAPQKWCRISSRLVHSMDL